MSDASERRELERLRDAVGELIGFSLERERLDQLGLGVRSRIAELGLSGLGAYVARLQAPEYRGEEVPVLAGLVTVTETFFHRSYDQVRAFLEVTVPLRLAQNGKRLRVLSLGCASGEEPFTLAIALAEAFPTDLAAWDLVIVGMDVNRAMLKKARSGRYSAWSLRATPEPIVERYFQKIGNEYQLVEKIMRMVDFREQNLVAPGLFDVQGADVIFCRNVIMYFAPDVSAQVVTKITRSLRAGGHLFLGHAETLRGLSHDYQLCHTHDTFYYQKRSESRDSSASEKAEPSRNPEPSPFPEIQEATSWFDAIQAASRRVAEMAAPSPAPERQLAVEASPWASTSPPRGLTEVLELMRRERFSEALSLLESLPADASDHPDALLLSAVLLTNHGQLALAERACEKLLDVDDLNAGAHYLKALCREHASDQVGAAEHDRIAAHLDPTFSMPRLHAGLIAKRAGDRIAAQRELSQALVLLERDETSRLVLFGGGFSRDALIALCKAELSRLGEELR